MSGWTFAWSDPEEIGEREQAAWKPLTARAIALLGVAVAGWFLLHAIGILPTLGSVDGSERHNRYAVYVSEESSFGLPSMFVLAGQRLWWDYDLTAEGRGGVRLRIASAVPRPGSVRFQDVTATGRGRFEVVAPESGLYHFEYELVPIPGAFGRTPPGSTRYRLSWGVD